MKSDIKSKNESKWANFAQRIVDLQMEELEKKRKYVDIQKIPPTSAVAEQLFSFTKTTFGDMQSWTTLENLENLLFLHYNAQFLSLHKWQDIGHNSDHA